MSRKPSTPAAEASAAPPRGPRSINEILAEAFERARLTAGKKLERGAASEAAFLGLSAGYLSRIRNGKAPLTDELVQRIAFSLEKHDEDRRKALHRDLCAARDAAPTATAVGSELPDISANAIIDFFDRIARPNSLLCVDYRDLPQAVSTGPFPRTALEAAYAVANGLSFAMFQPFGPVEVITERLIGSLRNTSRGKPHPCMRLYQYVLELAVRVRQVYSEMSEEVRKHEGAAGKHEGGELVLYEATDVPEVLIGLQSRVFYVDYTLPPRHYREVYEWVVGMDRHYFIQRGGESLDVEAMREQFHPITTYWLEHKRLPDSVKLRELAEGAASRWTVWRA